MVSGKLTERSCTCDVISRVAMGDVAVVDVPSRMFPAAVGDIVAVDVTRDEPPRPDRGVVLRGTVYATGADNVHVSCGGLLARVPGPPGVVEGDTLYIALTH